MPDTTINQALVDAYIAEMQRAIDDPNTDVSDHALSAAISFSDQPDGTIVADLLLVPGIPAYTLTEHTTRIEDNAIVGEMTFNMTSAAIQFSITPAAHAAMAIHDSTTDEWVGHQLKPEQQATADRYASDSCFWFMGLTNNALTNPGEDPDGIENIEDLEFMRADLLQSDIRFQLGKQVALTDYLAGLYAVDGELNAALLDAAKTIRIAAAKIARASVEPRRAHAFYRRAAALEPTQQRPDENSS